MSVNYLDCSSEAGEIQHPDKSRLLWLAREITDEDWIVKISAAALDEIDQLAESLQHNPLPILQRSFDRFALPASRELRQALVSALALLGSSDLIEVSHLPDSVLQTSV